MVLFNRSLITKFFRKFAAISELYNDIKSICAIPNYDHKFVESQEIGHVFHDPIAIYMEEFFIQSPNQFSVPPLSFMVPKFSVVKIKLTISF
jgi:hypothetical protein